MLNLRTIKGVVLEWSVLTAGYRAGSTVRANLFAALGRRWEALEARQRALRASSAREHSPEVMARVRAWLDTGCRDSSGALRAIADNQWLREYLGTSEARESRSHFASFASHHRVRMREPNDEDPQRQGNLILLKPYDPATAEKGVILLTYTRTLRRFPAMFDVSALASRYAFVLEPSSWGYEDAGLFLYAGSDMDVVVQAPWRRDHRYVEELRSNLEPVWLGAGDWVHPETFHSDVPAAAREFDLVAVSAWSALKRHGDLFRALARLNAMGRRLRVALIGNPLDWTQEKIRELAREHGVEAQCTFYDSVPQSTVSEIVGNARAYVLMSRREGANRALYEALFCDTPVIVFAMHRGVNTNIIGDGIGTLYEADGLPAAILRVLDNRDKCHARAWAEQHTGYRNSTAALNNTLRELSRRRGLPWTRDIVEKHNAPDLLYSDAHDVTRFAEEYTSLLRFMR